MSGVSGVKLNSHGVIDPRTHRGDHICIDGRRYTAGGTCLVTDPTCAHLVEAILAKGEAR